MHLLFPCHPLKGTLPDPDYESEVHAARQAGFTCCFYDLELLRAGNPHDALARCPDAPHPGTSILHRGWMMTDTSYDQLHTTLTGKGYLPKVTPEQYAQAHYLPNAYPQLAGLTPETVWMPRSDPDRGWNCYQSLATDPVILKDYVKSAKHRWKDACFIPPGTSRERFNEMLKNFLEARGSQFNKGLVFRRFHPLVRLEQDIRGQPVNEEYRMFFFEGELLAVTPPIRGKDLYEEATKWADVARRFSNPFISIDVARQEDDSWIIIEVGDGGVTGIPPSIELNRFY